MGPALVYLNGDYVPGADARIGIEDRGFQFGDSVYEVILSIAGKLVDPIGHIERLESSMRKMGFRTRPNLKELSAALHSLPERTAIADGFVYVQVTRGAWPRNMAPSSAPADASPTVVAYARALQVPRTLAGMRGLAVLGRPDRRWNHCDIKTTALAGNLIARADAQAAGADDAWLVAPNGKITEATAANAWIVRNGILITRDEGPEILGGITRRRVLTLARELGLPVRVTPFTPDEVGSAEEAFQTSATQLITPIASFDGVRMSDPARWPIANALFDAYLRFAGAY